MTPINHIFLFRSVIELCHKAKNIKVMNKMKVQINTRLCPDRFGRSYPSGFEEQAYLFDKSLERRKNVVTASSSMNSDLCSSPSLFTVFSHIEAVASIHCLLFKVRFLFERGLYLRVGFIYLFSSYIAVKFA